MSSRGANLYGKYKGAAGPEVFKRPCGGFTPRTSGQGDGEPEASWSSRRAVPTRVRGRHAGDLSSAPSRHPVDFGFNMGLAGCQKSKRYGK
jgi:hypothetical protein